MGLPNIYLFDFIGLLGAVLILLGFYRISIGRWSGRSLWYELDNLVGATCLVVYQLHHRAYISMVVNIIWAIIAFRGINSFAQRRASIAKKQKRRRPRTA